MLNINKKILKLVKLAIALVNKLVYTINKIEAAKKEADAKVEHLILAKDDLSGVVEKLEEFQKKLGDK